MLELAKTYDVCRSGEPKLTVVFLHGIASSSASFAGLFEHLIVDRTTCEMRLVAFDLLGSGKSYTSDTLEYNYDEQLEALKNAIDKLHVQGPLVIVGHSMGTMIATRFASQHKNLVKGLVLISAPVYREEDIKNPMFEKAMIGFREVVGAKSRELLESKAFNNEIKNIVSDVNNYNYLLKLDIPTIIIYGELDRIIASFNLPELVKQNPHIQLSRTAGAHGVTVDKYNKITSALKTYLRKGKNETL